MSLFDGGVTHRKIQKDFYDQIKVILGDTKKIVDKDGNDVESFIIWEGAVMSEFIPWWTEIYVTEKTVEDLKKDQDKVLSEQIEFQIQNL